jgi:hypothetical protein
MGLTLPDFVADKLPSDLGFANHIKNESHPKFTLSAEQFWQISFCSPEYINPGAPQDRSEKQ